MKKQKHRAVIISIIVIFVAYIFIINIFSEPESKFIEFEKRLGQVKKSVAKVIKQTADGGYVILSEITQKTKGLSGLYLIKTNKKGDIVWHNSFGGQDPRDVIQAADGGYVMLGNIRDNSNNELYMVKTDTKGEEDWYSNSTLGWFAQSSAKTIAQASDGGYFSAGKMRESETYLLKTDSAGKVIWFKTLNKSLYSYHAIETSDGGYIVAGPPKVFERNEPYRGIYVTKVDSKGDTVWEKTFIEKRICHLFSLTETLDGGYSLLAATSSSGHVRKNIYLLTVDNNGEIASEKKIEGSGEDWNNIVSGKNRYWVDDIEQTADGGYLFARNGGARLSGTSVIKELKNYFSKRTTGTSIFKLDPKGDLEWSTFIKGVQCRSGELTSDGGYVFTGKSSTGKAPLIKIKW